MYIWFPSFLLYEKRTLNWCANIICKFTFKKVAHFMRGRYHCRANGSLNGLPALHVISSGIHASQHHIYGEIEQKN